MPDARQVTIPTFIAGSALLAAGLVGSLVRATTTLATWNPAGIAGLGVVLIFASFALAYVLDREAERAAPARRAMPAVGGVLVAILLLTAGVSGALGSTRVGPSLDAPTPDAQAKTSALTTQTFAGSLQGAQTPLGGVGGTGSAANSHALSPPAGTRSFRVELSWSASGPGATGQLAVDVLSPEGKTLASKTGVSPLVLDVSSGPASASKIVVRIPDGGASTQVDYKLLATFFATSTPAKASSAR